MFQNFPIPQLEILTADYGWYGQSCDSFINIGIFFFSNCHTDEVFRIIMEKYNPRITLSVIRAAECEDRWVGWFQNNLHRED